MSGYVCELHEAKPHPDCDKCRGSEPTMHGKWFTDDALPWGEDAPATPSEEMRKLVEDFEVASYQSGWALGQVPVEVEPAEAIPEVVVAEEDRTKSRTALLSAISRIEARNAELEAELDTALADAEAILEQRNAAEAALSEARKDTERLGREYDEIERTLEIAAIPDECDGVALRMSQRVDLLADKLSTLSAREVDAARVLDAAELLDDAVGDIPNDSPAMRDVRARLRKATRRMRAASRLGGTDRKEENDG